MKRLLTLSSLLLLCLSTNAQSKYKLSLFATPMITSSKATDYGEKQLVSVKSLENQSKNSLRYNAGFLITRYIHPKLFIASGLSYTEYKDVFTLDYTSYDHNDKPLNFNHTRKFIYQYIDLPIQISYNVYSKSKYSVGLLASFEVNAPVGAKLNSTVKSYDTGITNSSVSRYPFNTESVDDLNFTKMGGLSITKQVANQKEIYMLLSYRQQTTKNYFSAHMIRVNYGYGVTLGFTFGFKKPTPQSDSNPK